MQSFTNVQILEKHVNDYFEINGKQMIKVTKKGEAVKFKNYAGKIKSSIFICANFKSILVSENNGKQNSDDSYTNKNQNQVGRSFGYKLVINLASLSSHS